jgi:Zn-dependent peptidase ImmA (M78 family)
MDEVEVQRRARAFVAHLDTRNIRDDLTVYAEAANARLASEELGKGESGYTVTLPSGRHRVVANASESEERQRFTVCHEIAHLVLELPSRHDEVPPWAYAKRDINEVMCDVFAAELLMPYELWNSKLPAGEPTAESIEYMATEFCCSFPAAASRYATLLSAPCAFVTMDRGFVRYAARSTSLRNAGAWISPRTPIPPGSVAKRLREAGQNATEAGTADQDVWFENWEKGLELSELARHYHRLDTTIALLWFSEEDLPEVEASRFGVRAVDDGGLTELTGELPWPSGKRRR